MRALPHLVFMSRWLQVPLYLGLIVAQAVYVVLFLKEVWHLVTDSMQLDETSIMLVVLGLIDVVMISNLLIMVIIGGYETFVSRLGLDGHPDEPEWLDHVNAGVLKVKLSMALISISSIHLLKTFISPDQNHHAHAPQTFRRTRGIARRGRHQGFHSHEGARLTAPCCDPTTSATPH
ncbi:TIGR00645 family protein [Paraburkholderia sp. CI3]|uniref:TIGR00645 family protein n=1 Tax=Paraburkholderia sp. CI3 TaxID=2991060 RepID=UPI003D219165